MIVFDWDDANRAHIAEHNVSTFEAEYALVRDPLDVEVEFREGEERLVQVGATANGRTLTVISVLRGERIRVVTAFNASRNRRMKFEQSRRERYGA